GVAQRALAAGAQIVNDISAFRFDSAMPEVVREAGAGVVLMHSRGGREEVHQHEPLEEPIKEIIGGLQEAGQRAVQSGVKRSAIVLDPGIGFGKRADESRLVLRKLDMFAKLEYPLLIGVSRKSFIRKITTSAPDALLWGTAASVASAV